MSGPWPRRGQPSLLYVTTVPDFLRAFLRPYAEHFRAQGWRVAAAASGSPPRGAVLDDRTWDAATIEAFPERFELGLARGWRGGWGVARAAHRLRDIVRSGFFDLVHVHTPVAGVAARIGLGSIRRSAGLSLIYTAHGFHFHSGRSSLQNLPWERLERWCAARTDWLVVMNEEDEKTARNWPEIPAQRVELMPGIGVDSARYGSRRRDQGGRDAFAAAGVPPGHRILLIVAELRPLKRIEDAIRAMQLLEDLPLSLCVAGQGPSRKALMDLASRIGVGARVHWLGYRTDVPEFLPDADALLLCSDREGLPRCVLEAMAAGVPVVASDIRGTKDLLAPDVGLLYPVGDVPGLAARIRQLLQHPSLADRLVLAGREKVGQHELGRVLQLHEDLYARALAARTGAARVRTA